MLDILQEKRLSFVDILKLLLKYSLKFLRHVLTFLFLVEKKERKTNQTQTNQIFKNHYKVFANQTTTINPDLNLLLRHI